MPRHPWPLLPLLLGLAATTTAGETKQCTVIDSVPREITTQGVYCLHQDLASNVIGGRAIAISASNVVLDCNGHTIDGNPVGDATNAFGVMAFERDNVSVRRCHLSGFRHGIWLRGRGATVEDNLVDASTTTGIYVYGDGGAVRGNRVLATGGSPLDAGTAFGIRTYGDVDVLDNTIAGVQARAGSGAMATGIYADVNDHGVVGENRVRDVRGDGAGMTVGIRVAGSVRASLHDNHLSNPGVADAIGLQCPFATSGIASGNHVNGFETGMQDCIDGGGNVLE